MSNTTVEQFAAELKRPVDDLLKQLKEAGVSKTSGSDSLTLDDKQLLNAYLTKKNGSNGGTISIRRTKTEVSTIDGVKVETRKRGRTVNIPSPEELVAQAKASQVQAPPVQAEKTTEDAAKAESESAARAEARAKAEAEAAKLKAAKSGSKTKPAAQENKPAEDMPKPASDKPKPVAGNKAAPSDKVPSGKTAESTPKQDKGSKGKEAKKPAKPVEPAIPQPVVSAEEQAQRDEEARRAAALRAHQEALLREKQERQARREAIKQQAEQQAKTSPEAKTAGQRTAKPAEKTQAAASASENKPLNPSKAKKEDRYNRDDEGQGRNAKGKGGKGGRDRNNTRNGDDERVRGGKKSKKLKLEPNQHAFQAPTEPDENGHDGNHQPIYRPRHRPDCGGRTRTYR